MRNVALSPDDVQGLRAALLICRERYAWTTSDIVIKRYAHDPQALERKRRECQAGGDTINRILAQAERGIS